ncbi:hypothetical protein DDT56_14325 [Brenneria corticis]|uniref:Uncharacterized protein n=1 Tax=Brenneria corticis TaxID=2173106 RepID=A0A2U1TX30_9GAMM|nr:hypothetical protein DDT56_14325 [Brenneria sp. CFCC 11842]
MSLSLIHKSKEPLEAMCILVFGSFLVLCFLLFVGVRNHAEVDDPANAPQGSGASQCRVGNASLAVRERGRPPKASRQRRDFSHKPGSGGWWRLNHPASGACCDIAEK